MKNRWFVSYCLFYCVGTFCSERQDVRERIIQLISKRECAEQRSKEEEEKPEAADKFPRTSLLLSSVQLMEEGYPMPVDTKNSLYCFGFHFSPFQIIEVIIVVLLGFFFFFNRKQIFIIFAVCAFLFCRGLVFKAKACESYGDKTL